MVKLFSLRYKYPTKHTNTNKIAPKTTINKSLEDNMIAPVHNFKPFLSLWTMKES